MVDWLMISHGLVNRIVDYDILDLEPNLSDHLPVTLDISISDEFGFSFNEHRVNDRCTQSFTRRWDKGDLNAYYNCTLLNITPILDEFRPLYSSVMTNHNLLHANNICRDYYYKPSISNHSIDNSVCRFLIDKYHPMVVDALIDASNTTIPQVKINVFKLWWSNELTNLKNKSIYSFNPWVSVRKPRSGLVFDLYKHDKYALKLCIKRSKQEAELIITNDLHTALCEKDNNGFWKLWKSKFDTNSSVNQPKNINGKTNASEIANEFSAYFGRVCTPNSMAYDVAMQDKFDSLASHYVGDYLSASDFFSVELVSRIICELKNGRASGLDGLTAEPLSNCHPSAHLIITYLCNLMLLSGHVPSQFGSGLTFPIPKIKFGNKTVSVEDFRGITVSPLLSKI